MRRRLAFALMMALIASGVVVAAVSFAGGRPNKFRADLIGYREVPAVFSRGSGVFRAEFDPQAGAINFRLRYESLEGVDTTQAHIHFGQQGVNGGVIAFLCGGSLPACPDDGGLVTGTITPADVIGPAGQGIAAGQFAEVVRALRAGFVYANVHTDKHPGGEIRGQVHRP